MLGDDRAPIATLRDKVLVAKALHQRGPCLRDPFGAPAGRGRLAGKPVTGHRRDHEMEGVRCAPAMRGGIGERSDDLQLFDHRTGPAVRHDQRQRIFMLGADMNEVDIQPIDFGDEVRHGVQPRLTPCASHSHSASSAEPAGRS